MKDFIKKHGATILWLLLFIGPAVTESPYFKNRDATLTIVGIIGTLLIVGYFTRTIESLTSSWSGAIGSILLLTILNFILMEWYAVNKSIWTKYGNEIGNILLVLVVTLPAFFISGLDRFVTKKSRIKVFLISSIVIFLVCVGPVWINSLSL
jgi:hypothetical protein|tara:strand:- start:667 stop:1122 length:456 start_codon:yes stop_codon:yes gene_type:complete